MKRPEANIISNKEIFCSKCKDMFLTGDYGTALEYFNLHADFCRGKPKKKRESKSFKIMDIDPEQLRLL